MRISDWSSDVCSSDLRPFRQLRLQRFDGVAQPLVLLRARMLLDREDHAVVELQRVGHDGHRAVLGAHGAGRVVDHPVADILDSGGAQMVGRVEGLAQPRSEEHTSELQSLMRISYAVFCLKKNNNTYNLNT